MLRSLTYWLAYRSLRERYLINGTLPYDDTPWHLAVVMHPAACLLQRACFDAHLRGAIYPVRSTHYLPSVRSRSRVVGR